MAMHQWNKEYESIRSASDAMGETNDCGVVAWSVVTGDDYRTAHYIVGELTKRPQRQGVPNWFVYLEAFKTMGYRLEPVKVVSRTMVTLQREMARMPGAYLVAVSKGRHVVGVRDGVVVDWTEGRRHRVCSVWRVYEDPLNPGYDWKPGQFSER